MLENDVALYGEGNESVLQARFFNEQLGDELVVTLQLHYPRRRPKLNRTACRYAAFIISVISPKVKFCKSGRKVWAFYGAAGSWRTVSCITIRMRRTQSTMPSCGSSRSFPGSRTHRSRIWLRRSPLCIQQKALPLHDVPQKLAPAADPGAYRRFGQPQPDGDLTVGVAQELKRTWSGLRLSSCGSMAKTRSIRTGRCPTTRMPGRWSS